MKEIFYNNMILDLDAFTPAWCWWWSWSSQCESSGWWWETDCCCSALHWRKYFLLRNVRISSPLPRYKVQGTTIVNLIYENLISLYGSTDRRIDGLWQSLLTLGLRIVLGVAGASWQTSLGTLRHSSTGTRWGTSSDSCQHLTPRE